MALINQQNDKLFEIDTFMFSLRLFARNQLEVLCISRSR